MRLPAEITPRMLDCVPMPWATCTWWSPWRSVALSRPEDAQARISDVENLLARMVYPRETKAGTVKGRTARKRRESKDARKKPERCVRTSRKGMDGGESREWREINRAEAGRCGEGAAPARCLRSQREMERLARGRVRSIVLDALFWAPNRQKPIN